MNYASVCLAILAFLVASPAWAFDACRPADTSAERLVAQFTEAAAARLPVKFIPLARRIKVDVVNDATVMVPLAMQQGDERRIIVGVRFADVLCTLVFAYAIVIEDDSKQPIFDEALKAASACFKASFAAARCYIGLADDLSRRFPKDGERALANPVFPTAAFRAALGGILMHEYAHHFLDHFGKLRAGTIARADAEFEADFFAISNSVQAGDVPTAMYYFFRPLAQIESPSPQTRDAPYESASCRAKNVENITGAVDFASTTVIDIAYGERFTLVAAPQFPNPRLEEHFAKGPPALVPGSCGRMAATYLAQAFNESKTLYRRLEVDHVLLEASITEANPEALTRLFDDLMKMARSLTAMKGVATKALSLMAWRRRSAPGTPLADRLERLLADEDLAGYLPGEDYGRLLHTQAAHLIWQRFDLEKSKRRAQAFAQLEKAVEYAPALAEAWGQMAMISATNGDCVAALRFTKRSLETLSPGQPDVEKNLTTFRVLLEAMQSDPRRCAEVFSKTDLLPDKP